MFCFLSNSQEFALQKNEMIYAREKVNKTNAVVRIYSWGPEAQGVPGTLRMIADNNSVYFPAYDPNGNVMGLVKASDGTVCAQYEYLPYGEQVTATGTMASSNPFRFSTKYRDNETDLYYYGYRYYSPSLGRWISRDPIDEQGGLNLYVFVNNDPVNKWDGLGLAYGNPVSGLGRIFPSDPYAPCGFYYLPGWDSGWDDALKMFIMWLLGQSKNVDFKEDTIQSIQMKHSIVGEKLRQFTLDKFKNGYCSDWWEGVDNFKASFSLHDAWEEWREFDNGTASFVGSATGSAETLSVKCPEGKVTVEFKLVNTTSLTSFLYRKWRNEWNVTTPGKPFSNWKQTYRWKETFDCSCCN